MSNKQSDFGSDIERAGNQFVESVQDAVRKGNMRRLMVTAPDDTVYLETTLTIAFIFGTAILLWAFPLLIILGIAAIVARVRIDIVRVEETEVDNAYVEAVSKISVDATVDDEQIIMEEKPKKRISDEE